jgi:hypothetical protein
LGYLSSSNNFNKSAFTLAPKKEKDSLENKALKTKIEDLELQLEAYKRMIKLAEEKFNIPIEKKSDTK